MRYYMDCEFIEGFHKPWFGKRRHYIDLISIGIVADDGREYFAISNEYDYKDANAWVRENVIMPFYTSCVHGDNRNHISEKNFHKVYGRSNARIAKEIVAFVNPHQDSAVPSMVRHPLYRYKHNISNEHGYAQPDFYGYFADYDWVLFCSLFGTMMDLPKGFPMYMLDIKQMLDAGADSIIHWGTAGAIDSIRTNMSMEEKVKIIEQFPGFPVNENEHDALADARWTRKLHCFLIDKG
jgi:hypothetical protein